MIRKVLGAFVSSEAEGRITLAINRIYVRPRSDQTFDHLYFPGAGSRMETRFSIVPVSNVHRYPTREKLFDGDQISIACRYNEKFRGSGTAGNHINKKIQQKLIGQPPSH